MTREALELINSYGLPGWVTLIIGGGTIVAAVITAMQAILVAWIAAWSARRVAIYTAHKDYRLELAKPVRSMVRRVAPVCLTIRSEGGRSREKVLAHHTTWAETLDRERATLEGAYIADGVVEQTMDAADARIDDIITTMKRIVKSDDGKADLRGAVDDALRALELVEQSVEAYEFQLTWRRRRVKWLLALDHARASYRRDKTLMAGPA